MLIYIPKFEINLVSKKSDSNVWDLCIYIVYLWLDLRKKNVCMQLVNQLAVKIVLDFQTRLIFTLYLVLWWYYHLSFLSVLLVTHTASQL